MARNYLNSLILVVLSVATLLHGSAAQTRHVVGDSTGWTIASGGAAFYTNWAANKTFKVGDTLVFNFANGQHDVAKVTKSAYDACNGGNTIFTIMNSPASVQLNETGEQYYICTFNGHCSAGQKLTINVGGKDSSTSPAPQPSAGGSPSPKTSPVPAPAPQSTATPPPRSAPTPSPASAPAPSTGPVTYTVGDTIGWTIPSNGAAAYTSWVSGKTFRVGDILVFNFPRNAHNVEEVTKDKFDSCSSTSPIATYSTPPVRVTLNKTGQHFFICGVPGHCTAGQKLALNVTGSSTVTSPSPATPPSSGAIPPSGSTTPSPPTNPSSPSPDGSATSPPPQNSGAESLGPVTILLSVAAAAATFFYPYSASGAPSPRPLWLSFQLFVRTDKEHRAAMAIRLNPFPFPLCPPTCLPPCLCFNTTYFSTTRLLAFF